MGRNFNKMQKIVYLEYLRVICAITVLLDHIAIAAIHIWDFKATDNDRFFYYGVQHWSHFAVPVFLMISGFLLLQPKREVNYKKILTKYVWRMFVVLAVIGTVYAFMEIYFISKITSPLGLIQAFYNMLQGNTWKHMWYIYTLIGIYLVLPVIKPISEHLSTKTIDVFLCIMFFFVSVMPMISAFTDFKLGVSIPITSIYLFYFILGWRVGKINTETSLSKIFSSVWMLLAIMASLFFVSWLEHIKGFSSLEQLSDYSSPLVVVSGVCLFQYVKTKELQLSSISNREGCISLIIKHLSNNSFGIYVFHMLWINIIYKEIKFCPLDYDWWIIILLAVVILILSNITTLGYRKVPIIGKYI